jgi:hypothetical protein
MRIAFNVIASAAALATGLTMLPLVTIADEPARVQAAQIANPTLPAGVEGKDLKNFDGIRDSFFSLTKSALKKDVFDDVTDRLVDADKDRIKQWKDHDNRDLEARVIELQKIWKDKYGHEYDPTEKYVFTGEFLKVSQGTVADPGQLVGKWPVMVLSEADAPMAGEKGMMIDTSKQAMDKDKTFGGTTKLEKDRDVAVVTYPTAGMAPSLTVSMIKEVPDSWRFDIPDNVDGQKLHDNLLLQLNKLGDGSKWPADENEAYRAVTRHVLIAIYDINLKPGSAHHAG